MGVGDDSAIKHNLQSERDEGKNERNIGSIHLSLSLHLLTHTQPERNIWIYGVSLLMPRNLIRAEMCAAEERTQRDEMYSSCVRTREDRAKLGLSTEKDKQKWISLAIGIKNIRKAPS